MAKKKKKTAPLSTLDKAIYGAVKVLLTIAILAGLILLGIWLPRKLGFIDPAVVAATYKVWEMMFAGLFVAVAFFVPLSYVSMYSDVIPLFGSRKHPLDASKYVIESAPLFSKRFFSEMSAEKKKTLIKRFGTWLLALFITAGVMGFSWMDRETVRSDGVLRQYNGFNVVTNEMPLEQADQINISVYLVYGAVQSRKHQLQFDFVYGKETYRITESETHLEELLTCLAEVSREHGEDLFKNSDYYAVKDLMDSSEFYSDREKELLYEILV